MMETQLINGDGEFNPAGLWEFINSVKFHGCGFSYAVVAIFGDERTGKSTLMNHLFSTNFKEMDVSREIKKITKGIWIGEAVGIEPFTIVMDLESTDGCHQRDDSTFAEQRVQFALALPNLVTVIINICRFGFGSVSGVINKPLLITMFQAKLRLLNPRKTTLIFVIIDKAVETPLEYLDSLFREEIQKIWESLPKARAYMNTPLTELFSVEITALSHYILQREQYNNEVAELRQQFFHPITPRAVVPASGFAFFAEQIWKTIKENNDFDLHVLKAMVATVACEEIANEKFSRLARDEEWLGFQETLKSGVVSGFGKNMSSLLKRYLSEYNSETKYFEQGARKVKLQYLESKILQWIDRAYIEMLGHLRSTALESFVTGLDKLLNRGEGFAASVGACKKSSMSEFDRACSDAAFEQAIWGDARKVRDQLVSDIELHASHVRQDKLSQLVQEFEKKRLSATLVETMEHVLEGVYHWRNAWASIRGFLKDETDLVASGFASAVAGFELEPETVDELVNNLKNYARKLVERKLRKEAGKAMTYMNDRFSFVFKHDDDFAPRFWTGDEDIGAITMKADLECLKLLSCMAVIRLDDEEIDDVENVLFSTLMVMDRDITLASNTWDKIPEEKTLIKPYECINLWRQFKLQRASTIKEAITAQEAYKRSHNLLPQWAIMAMRCIGCIPL